MSEEPYLGMRPGDLDGKPYAKYYQPVMAPMQPHVQQAVMHGVVAPELGFPVSEANQMLESGYLPLENGFTRLDNGQVYVAALTQMPGVDGKMIDWWFGWEFMENQRFKLWYPHTHRANRAERMIGDDPDLGDRDKYLHNPNHITEYVGRYSFHVTVTFLDASEFFDVSRFGEAGVSTAICGVVAYQEEPLSFGLQIHLIRETEEGCEMRSRFWLGRIGIDGLSPTEVLNRLASSQFVAEQEVPINLGHDMLVHCAMEMNHLAGFLPGLYAEYH